LCKLHNGPFLGIFRGGLDFFDPLEISLEMAHYIVCPQKKIISRIFKISGALIVIFCFLHCDFVSISEYLMLASLLASFCNYCHFDANFFRFRVFANVVFTCSWNFCVSFSGKFDCRLCVMSIPSSTFLEPDDKPTGLSASNPRCVSLRQE
jgi:hypothetical protein